MDWHPSHPEPHFLQPVILAGGSGTRLWPASRRDRPKQLLALTGRHSLLQETAIRLQGFESAAPLKDPVVVVNREYGLAVAAQLAEIGIVHPRIVLEPVGRNTAPALTLACLSLPEGVGDPVLMVMASDHVIRDISSFQRAVAEGAAQAAAGMLVLFGITPDRPETGYGYISVGEALPRSTTALRLRSFREKPDRRTAEAYLQSGDHLWNSGMLMVTRSVWLRAITLLRPDIYQACRAAIEQALFATDSVSVDETAFLTCPAESIDRAVTEHLPLMPTQDLSTGNDDGGAGLQAVVIPLDCGWSDVGSWAALADVCTPDETGNVVHGAVLAEDSHGNLVRAESRLVALLGVHDLVVVDTADALLVADKQRAGDVHDLVTRVNEKNEGLTLYHRRRYRPWGHFDCIDGGERFQVKHLVVAPGETLSLQVHQHRTEHWVVVRGVADVTCGDRSFRLTEDQSTYMPRGMAHRLSNPGTEPLEIIEVQSGDYLGEGDIVRLEDHYGRAERTSTHQEEG